VKAYIPTISKITIVCAVLSALVIAVINSSDDIRHEDSYVELKEKLYLNAIQNKSSWRSRGTLSRQVRCAKEEAEAPCQ
jgi:hypothetical protein